MSCPECGSFLTEEETSTFETVDEFGFVYWIDEWILTCKACGFTETSYDEE